MFNIYGKRKVFESAKLAESQIYLLTKFNHRLI